MTVQVDVGPMSIDDVVAVARDGAPVALTDDAVAAIEKARAVVEALAAATDPAYGISTGFGALATRHIPAEMREQLQRSLVRSHAAGSGPEVEREVVRALMLLRLSTLATGHTGHPPRDGRADGRRCCRRGSRRWCASTGRWAAPATSPRCRTARSR